jgi:hypothetical protein
MNRADNFAAMQSMTEQGQARIDLNQFLDWRRLIAFNQNSWRWSEDHLRPHKPIASSPSRGSLDQTAETA